MGVAPTDRLHTALLSHQPNSLQASGCICCLHLPEALPTTPLSTQAWGRGLNLPLGEADIEIGYFRHVSHPPSPQEFL